MTQGALMMSHEAIPTGLSCGSQTSGSSAERRVPAELVSTRPESSVPVDAAGDPLSRLATAVLRGTTESVWVLDEQGRTLWTNERLCVLLGASADFLQQQTFFDYATCDASASAFEACRAAQSEQLFEIIFTKGTATASAAIRLFPFGPYGRSSAAILAILTDVTRERQAEAAMFQAVQELKHAMPGALTPGGAASDENAGDDQRLLVLANQVAAANKELEAFSYSVSHDLRAPLRSIDGFSRILEERYGPLLDDKAKDYLERVRAAAQRMGQLIADMLTLARISRAEMSPERVDISELAHSIHTDLADSAPERRVFVDISDGLSVHGDPRLLRVVLTNLLENAWKFTGNNDDARIEVTGLRSATDDVFRISDNGAGFEMKYVEKLFRPFQRLHTESEFAGTGVGLATVQRILARHGGRAWAEASPGRGASIFVSIPRPSLCGTIAEKTVV